MLTFLKGIPNVLLIPTGEIAVEQPTREYDRARILHAAKTRRADNQRELLVRIRRDLLSEELQRRYRRRETLFAPARALKAARSTKAE